MEVPFWACFVTQAVLLLALLPEPACSDVCGRVVG